MNNYIKILFVLLVSNSVVMLAQNSTCFGSRMQRTMSLLEASSELLKNEVKLVFYGQSIQKQDYVKRAIELDLKTRFPHARLIIKNPSIGGFTAPSLSRTAYHDLIPEYPDLIIFHVYDGLKSGDFERIIKSIRSKTTAEILLWTHHIDNNTDRKLNNEANSKFRKYIAQKYNCELVELRKEWQLYLDKFDLKPSDLLIDAVHLNGKGGELMGEIVKKHFIFNAKNPSNWYNQIKEYDVADVYLEDDNSIEFTNKKWNYREFKINNYDMFRGMIASQPSQVLKMKFKGNRVDLVSFPHEEKLGSAKILIDGKPVSEHRMAYAITRPNGMPKSPWPAFRRISTGKNPIEESWTLKMKKVSSDGKKYNFEAIGSVSGKNGFGTEKSTFISDSNRIEIMPFDNEMPHSIKYSEAKGNKGFEVKFDVYLMGTDLWIPKMSSNENAELRTTIIQGIENKEHVLEIIPNGNGVLPLQKIIIYEPPLK